MLSVVNVLMHPAAIALGSNLGDRRATIAAALRAIEALPRTHITRVSDLFETDPVGPGAQGKYLNAAALLTTSLPPRELLDHLLAIERSLGRTRTPHEQWGPRTIDLDLLLYADLILNEPSLTLPHPRMHQRRFVLEPLAQIAPDLTHPILHKPISDLLLSLS